MQNQSVKITVSQTSTCEIDLQDQNRYSCPGTNHYFSFCQTVKNWLALDVLHGHSLQIGLVLMWHHCENGNQSAAGHINWTRTPEQIFGACVPGVDFYVWIYLVNLLSKTAFCSRKMGASTGSVALHNHPAVHPQLSAAAKQVLFTYWFSQSRKIMSPCSQESFCFCPVCPSVCHTKFPFSNLSPI